MANRPPASEPKISAFHFLGESGSPLLHKIYVTITITTAPQYLYVIGANGINLRLNLRRSSLVISVVIFIFSLAHNGRNKRQKHVGYNARGTRGCQRFLSDLIAIVICLIIRTVMRIEFWFDYDRTIQYRRT